MKEKINLRDELTSAFNEYIESASTSSVDRILKIAKLSPGTRPLGDYRNHIEKLEQLCKITGYAPTTRITYADALHSDGQIESANSIYQTLIRSLRPNDRTAGTDSAAKNIRDGVQGQPIWHSIDLGNDFIEGRRKTSKVLAHEMLKMNMPDLENKSVLDIGAFGGWFSFEAERRGAKSVTALDYYSWAVDYIALHKWMNSERDKGFVANPYLPPDHVIDEGKQPGRNAFDLTHEALNSKVLPSLGVFEETDIEPHDVVFHLGVLYHCENPLATLRKVASVTKELLILETLGICVHGSEKPLWEFYGDNSINNDVTTWWAPTETGLIDILIAAGFSRVEIMHGDDTIPTKGFGEQQAIRIWAKAWK